MAVLGMYKMHGRALRIGAFFVVGDLRPISSTSLLRRLLGLSVSILNLRVGG